MEPNEKLFDRIEVDGEMFSIRKKLWFEGTAAYVIYHSIPHRKSIKVRTVIADNYEDAEHASKEFGAKIVSIIKRYLDGSDYYVSTPTRSYTPTFDWEKEIADKEERQKKDDDARFEELNKSDTLVIHKSDPTTTMLDQIYKGKGWDVINDVFKISKPLLHRLLESHKRIVMLGHGSGYGLFGSIGPDEADYLAAPDKKLFALWCNADAYCDRYLPKKKGFFACGNMPSDAGEARWVGYHVSEEYMLENITYWCKLCGDVVEQCLEGDAKAGCKYIRDKYWEKYGHSDDPDEVGITTYNYQRTKTAGEKLIPAPKE